MGMGLELVPASPCPCLMDDDSGDSGLGEPEARTPAEDETCKALPPPLLPLPLTVPPTPIGSGRGRDNAPPV